MNKFLKFYIKNFTIFTLIILTWFFLHEISHVIVCYLSNGTSTLFQILPHPAVTCTVKNTWIYLAPYILSLIISIFILIKKFNPLIKLMITFILSLDLLYNFFISAVITTDFTNNSIGILLFIPIIVIHAIIYSKNIKKLKEIKI